MNSIFNRLLTDVDPDVYKTITLIFIMLIVMRFILLILRKFLDYKLKNKIIDKEIPQDLAASILQSDAYSEKHNSIKWFLIFISSGFGFFLVNQFLPLGIHSLGIMFISISIGFLTYIIYLNRFDK